MFKYLNITNNLKSSSIADAHAVPELDQLRLSQTLLLYALIPLGLFLSAIFIAFYKDWFPLPSVSYWTVGSALSSTALSIIGLYLARSETQLRAVLKIVLVLPAIVLIMATYQNGYLPATLFSFSSLVILFAWRGRYSMLLAYGIILCWGISYSLSAVQVGQPYVARLLAVSAMLIWPINTLLNFHSWEYKVRLKALSQLLTSFFFISLPVVLFVSNSFGALIVMVVNILIFGFLLKLSTRKNACSVWGCRAVALVFTALFFTGLIINGFLAAMFLPVVSLLVFLVLPKAEASFISVGMLLMGVYAFFSIGPTDFDPIPFFARWAVASMIFITLLNILARKFEAKDRNEVFEKKIIPTSYSVFIFFMSGLCSGLFILTTHQGFAGHLQSFPPTPDDLNYLALNAFAWLFITWIISSFTFTLLRLRSNETALKAALSSEQAATVQLLENRDKQLRMFAVISHELRTPITSIKMLQEDMGLAEVSEQGQVLAKTTESVLSILEDLRSVMNPEQVKQIRQVKESPYDLVERSVNALSGILHQHNIMAHLSANTEASQLCRFGAQSVRQIVTNLSKNAAIHARATDLWIDISAELVDENLLALQLTIEDNGRGIHGLKRTELFEAFSRGDTDADGTGLGLFITKELADSLGAEIAYFDSEHGGAGFRLNFTVERIDEDETVDTLIEPELSLEGMRILFAEDQKTIQMLSCKQLEKQGSRLVGVLDGVEALKAFNAEGPFDLVITDLNMPNMNGVVLTQTLRERGYTGQIIAVTAATTSAEVDRLIAAGVGSVLQKPINMSELKRELWRLENISAS